MTPEDYDDMIDDYYWQEEAMRHRERVRRSDEADGFYQQEEDENE